MGMVGFLPWLGLEEEVRFPDFALVPYRRGEAPGRDANEQAVLDRVIAPYYVGLKLQANVAAIFQLGARGLTDELSEDEREEAFSLAEVIAFGGLAAREYFGFPGATTYCNTETFQLLIQSFRAEPGGVALVHRGRDGARQSYYTADAYRVHKPHHVARPARVVLDVPLMRSLLAARAAPEWERIGEALHWFNLANTDSDAVRVHTEVVMMVGAFARLFDVGGGRIENDLAPVLVAALRPEVETLATAAPRGIPAPPGGAAASVREAWIRDFVRVRHEPAHGRRAAGRRSIWSIHEHLLLGAQAFPLAVKAVLSQPPFSTYTLTEEDRGGIELFERFAGVEPYSMAGEEGHEVPAWEHIRRGWIFEAAARRMRAARQRWAERGQPPEGGGET